MIVHAPALVMFVVIPVPRLLSNGRGKWQLAPIGPKPLLRLLSTSTLSTILTDWTLFATVPWPRRTGVSFRRVHRGYVSVSETCVSLYKKAPDHFLSG